VQSVSVLKMGEKPRHAGCLAERVDRCSVELTLAKIYPKKGGGAREVVAPP